MRNKSEDMRKNVRFRGIFAGYSSLRKVHLIHGFHEETDARQRIQRI